MPVSTLSPRPLLASLFLVLVAGCSAGDSTAPSTPPPPPPSPPPAPASRTGDLVVQVVPLFGDLGIPVEVLVTVVGEGINISESSTSLRLSGLMPGTYTVELALIDDGTFSARGCRVQGTNRRIAEVAAGASISVVFGVYCLR